MLRITTIWRLFTIIFILAIFVDKSFEMCRPISSYETVCRDEKIIRDQPLLLSGEERILRFQTKTEVIPPGTFGLLPKLRKLELKSIELTRVEPGAFENLGILAELLLNSNRLTIIENNVFDDCPNLKYLYLDHNKISTIENSAFNKLTQLKELNLSFNQLKKIPEALRKLSGLKKLNLVGNFIVQLFANNFNGLGLLETLKLGGNKIQEIEKDTFKGLIDLKLLGLTGNKLKDLDANNIANNSPKLRNIKLGQNLFRCRILKPIIETFENKKINVAPSATDCKG